ncbi:hypothetical protein [Spongiactinospora sp. 9N601]|uniref:hypothetical protein n=1 Tax=Spongiactinospora sp. 9N601 TaxID=3375149 RepID=UPI00379BFD45
MATLPPSGVFVFGVSAGAARRAADRDRRFAGADGAGARPAARWAVAALPGPGCALFFAPDRPHGARVGRV